MVSVLASGGRLNLRGCLNLLQPPRLAANACHSVTGLLLAVVNQLVKAGVIDDVFSLCFGMVEGDGALLLGDAGECDGAAST